MPGGHLFFECHENYANDVAMLMKDRAYTQVDLREDLQGKARMLGGLKE
jgi:hypothetical protein